MGKVGISIKVMPENPEVDLEAVKAKISEKFHVEDCKTEPVAFGLKSLNMLILTEDKGGTDPIEDYIKNIDGVSTVEIISVSII